MNSLGYRLKTIRKKQHLTQEDIAEKLNINRVTYQGYETDKHKPDVDTLVLIADYFNISTDFLLGRYSK